MQDDFVVKTDLIPLQQIPIGVYTPKYITYSDELKCIIVSQENSETTFISPSQPDVPKISIRNDLYSGMAFRHQIYENYFYRIINVKWGSVYQKSYIQKFDLLGQLINTTKYDFCITSMLIYGNRMYIGTWYGAIKKLELVTFDTVETVYVPNMKSREPLFSMHINRDRSEMIVGSAGFIYFFKFPDLTLNATMKLLSNPSPMIHCILEIRNGGYYFGSEGGSLLFVENYQIVSQHRIQLGRINNLYFYDNYVYSISYDRTIVVFDHEKKCKIVEYEPNWTMQSTCVLENYLVITHERRQESFVFVCPFPHAPIHRLKLMEGKKTDLKFFFV